ncbi:MAG: 2-C-methyl-D-erythritol 2,4-cyclodiphosphate synthase [Candidatus Enteromonas sp.]|nr:2-C-methyl-D-erythritol 2,4-cyclodiphosphate synthase [Candidatus Enteromonas sp.]
MSHAFRIGYGEDIHRLGPNRKLILAGVEIPYELGLIGHSDADVVFHAVSDALLGALALGDIGKYFPPNDPRYEGYDSSLILKECYAMVQEKGYRLGNLDVALLCEKPHLSRYSLAMRQNLASLLLSPIEDIGLQLMTNEGLDAVGEGKAIRATAILLLERTQK